jgi:hypothetical protein
MRTKTTPTQANPVVPAATMRPLDDRELSAVAGGDAKTRSQTSGTSKPYIELNDWSFGVGGTVP